MLILPGAAAFCPFRLQRLHSRLGGEAGGIRGIVAQFVHFADVDGALDTTSKVLLDRLLNAIIVRRPIRRPAGLRPRRRRRQLSR